jgi:uncharacterized membrane protein YeaQ/YmgE (transglycosylase-associated protein family)
MISVGQAVSWSLAVAVAAEVTPYRQSTTDNEEARMSFIAWIVLGLIAGFIGSKIVNKRGEGLLLDILLGIIGAIVGGWIFRAVGMSGVTGLNIYSLVVAVVGAIVLLAAYHLLFRRRT